MLRVQAKGYLTGALRASAPLRIGGGLSRPLNHAFQSADWAAAGGRPAQDRRLAASRLQLYAITDAACDARQVMVACADGDMELTVFWQLAICNKSLPSCQRCTAGACYGRVEDVSSPLVQLLCRQCADAASMCLARLRLAVSQPPSPATPLIVISNRVSPCRGAARRRQCGMHWPAAREPCSCGSRMPTAAPSCTRRGCH